MSTTNVIDVTFGNSTLVFVQDSESLRYQYNEGIYLNFTDLDLPSVWTAEFCNEGVAPVYSMVGSGTQVEIPVDVMGNNKAIYGYIMDTSIEDTVITRAEVRIPPIKRAPRPEGTEPTPSQQTLVEQALTALNSAVDACEDAVEQTESNVSHYPKIENGTWHVWDAENSAWVDTEVTAEGEDGVGITSIEKTATVDLVDTYTVTFTDGTTFDYTVTNGSDGDDGRGIASIAKTSTVDLVDTYTITYTDGTTSTFTVTNGADGQDSDVSMTDLLKAFPTDTASGAVASFTDGASLPLKSLVVGIEPSQSGSGDPSPTNVRPISGWTGANINANGTTIAVDWTSEAGTVYGGTLDVLTGVLTVTHGFCETTFGDAETRETTDEYIYKRFSLGFNPVTGTANNICNIATYSGTTALGKFNVSSSGLAYIKLPPDTNDSQAIQVVSKLATPLTYQLTAQEVSSLLGSNSIYADCGDTTVEYRADPTLYIAKKISEAVSALS